jgi:CDP-glucose 4,6-dehydratase
MTNTLITGVTGFLGRALAENCSGRVVGLGFDTHTQPMPNVTDMIYGDVRDKDLMRRIISDYEINEVFHMAAQSIVRVCETDPATAYDINIMGTVSLLEACRTFPRRINSIVISTSDKVYGHTEPPYDENTHFDPWFIYETSKACQDMVAMSYYAHGSYLPVKIVRCANVYGPGDPNLSRLIPATINNALQGKPPVLYDGVKDYVREFMYIDDVVDAFLTVSDKGFPGNAYCVGAGKGYRILDVVEEICDLVNPHLSPVIRKKELDFGEIEKQWMDSTKIRSLGWEPKIGLTTGLLRTIRYYENQQ